MITENRSQTSRAALPRTLDHAIDLSRLNNEWVWYTLLFVASIGIHMFKLGDMAMAHDESVVSYMSWKFFTGRGGFTCAGGIASQTYCYDPVYHGPTQYFLQFAAYFLFGVSDWSSRLPMALAVIGLIPMCWLLRPIIGKRMALVSAVLVTLSPSLVYYSRYARHDALMVLWTMFMVVGIFRWLQRGKTGDLVLAAVGLALGWATHELIFIVGFIGVTFFAFRALWELRPRWFLGVTAFGIVVGGIIVILTALNAPAAGAERSGEYLLLQRMLGPGMLLGGGALLTLLMSRGWTQAPVFVQRVSAMWAARRTSEGTPVKGVFGVVPAALLWAIVGFLVTFALLFTTFFAYPRGFFQGFYAGIQYWLGSQHEYARGGQPWYYYFMLLPIYELLALVFTLGGMVALFLRRPHTPRVAATVVDEVTTEGVQTVDGPQGRGINVPTTSVSRVRIYGTNNETVKLAEQDGDPVVRDLYVPFTLYWAILSFIAYTWAGEKMPWLLIHIALPTTLFAASVIGGLIERIDWRTVRLNRGWAVPLLALLAIISLLVGSTLLGNRDATQTGVESLFRGLMVLLVAGVAVFGLWTLGTQIGQRNMLRLTALSLAGVLALYSVRAISLVVYQHPDTPVEPLIYTQTSPDVPRVMAVVEQTALNQSRNQRTNEDPTGSYSMRMSIDNELAWPIQWYLRDYRNLDWKPMDTPESVPDYNASVVLIHTPHVTEPIRQSLQQNGFVKYTAGVFNWWFPEGGTVTDPNDSTKQVRAYKELDKDSPIKVLLWPFMPSNWKGLGSFMLRREIPQKIEGREFEMYIKAEIGPVVGGGGGETTTTGDPIVITDSVLAPTARFGLGEIGIPRGVAVGPDTNVYVTDPANHRIVVYSPTGQQLKVIGGERGSGPGQFNEPSGVSLDDAGNIYVADTWNARIVKLDKDAAFVQAWGNGTEGLGDGKLHTDTNGDATQNQANPLGFFGPRNVLVIGDRVYVADTGNKRIVVTDLSGNYVEQFGTFGKNKGQFHEPIGLGEDALGRLYVGDTWNSRVQIFARNAEQQINPQPVGDFRVNNWSANTYNDPYLTVLPDGRTVVAVPEAKRLSVYDLTGKLTTRLTDPQVTAPHGLATTANGEVVAADNSGLVVIFPVP